ncbi:MAG TPA: hypothetical protein DCX92_07950 [Bacteroidetes bacterium]|nr:hypothetical protein [Bacteroidota bacterium]
MGQERHVKEKFEMKNNLIQCYGCKAVIKNVNGPKHAYIGSDAGCWDIFCGVLAKEYTDYNELWQTHRLTVDTYAAQHPGNPGRKEIQSVFIHLTRLYLQLERGITGKRANDVMLNISKFKEQYAWLDPVPDFAGTLNITHVAEAKNITEHKQAVELWAVSVWKAWSRHHDTIKYFVEHNNILSQYRKDPAYGK